MIEEYVKQTDKLTKSTVGILVDENNVILGLRKSSSTDLGLGLIAGIGGKHELGESDEECFIREFKEEVGTIIENGQENIVCQPLEFKKVGRVRFFFKNKPIESSWNQDVAVYACTKWAGTPVETESTKPLTFNSSKIPFERMWPDNQYWIPKLLNNEQFNAVFIYEDAKQIAEYKLEL